MENIRSGSGVLVNVDEELNSNTLYGEVEELKYSREASGKIPTVDKHHQSIYDLINS